MVGSHVSGRVSDLLKLNTAWKMVLFGVQKVASLMAILTGQSRSNSQQSTLYVDTYPISPVPLEDHHSTRGCQRFEKYALVKAD